LSQKVHLCEQRPAPEMARVFLLRATALYSSLSYSQVLGTLRHAKPGSARESKIVSIGCPQNRLHFGA
jgi:hypothetical protein